MFLGSAMYRVACRLPRRVSDRLQQIANTSPLGRAILARATAPMRHGAHRIAAGPAAGMLMDVAGSRPSYLLGIAEPTAVQFAIDHVRPGDTVFAGLPTILCEVQRFEEGDHQRIVRMFERRGDETKWLDKGGWISNLVARARSSPAPASRGQAGAVPLSPAESW